MKRELKYIRTENGFIVFSEPLMHSEIIVPGKKISAGFCSITEGSAKCWGESVSLNLIAKDEDGELLTIQINRMWR